MNDWTPPRPDLMDLFTPRRRHDGPRGHRFDLLDWDQYCPGVHVAKVLASFIDWSSKGIAGWIAMTTPKRATRQADAIVWVGNLRVKVAPDAGEKTTHVYHVGTGGPLFPTLVAAGEAARIWRWGEKPCEQYPLPVGTPRPVGWTLMGTK